MELFYVRVNKSKTRALLLPVLFHVNILSINSKRQTRFTAYQAGCSSQQQAKKQSYMKKSVRGEHRYLCGYEYEYRDWEHRLKNEECLKSGDERCTIAGRATHYGKIVM